MPHVRSMFDPWNCEVSLDDILQRSHNFYHFRGFGASDAVSFPKERWLLVEQLVFSDEQDTFGASFRHGVWLCALSGAEAPGIAWRSWDRTCHGV